MIARLPKHFAGAPEALRTSLAISRRWRISPGHLAALTTETGDGVARIHGRPRFACGYCWLASGRNGRSAGNSDSDGPDNYLSAKISERAKTC
jgi:hypothetical protein